MPRACSRSTRTPRRSNGHEGSFPPSLPSGSPTRLPPAKDRKSTRLNSSHLVISYAVFCLKKKKKISNSTFANPKSNPRSDPPASGPCRLVPYPSNIQCTWHQHLQRTETPTLLLRLNCLSA